MAYTEHEARKLVVEAGRRLLERGLVARTWGNISARVSDTHFIITPSGMAYDTMTEDHLVLVDGRDGSYQGERKPSSERGIHADAYRLRPAVNFVIPHPPGHGQRLLHGGPGPDRGPPPPGGTGPLRRLRPPLQQGPAPGGGAGGGGLSRQPRLPPPQPRGPCVWAGTWRTPSPSRRRWRRSAPGRSRASWIPPPSQPGFRTTGIAFWRGMLSGS